MKIDSLRQSVKGPAAAGFVPRIIRICTIHLFVLGTKLHEALQPTAIRKGACGCSFCPKNNQDLYNTFVSGTKLDAD